MNAGTRPRVSVVIPNYNHAKLLPRCLDAVLGQSVLPDEVIVLDDASQDDSRELIAAYARRSSIVKPCPNERNLGVVATINRGLELARGDYIAFLAADDRILPGWSEKCLPWIERHPESGAVCGLCEWQCEATGLVWYQGSRMPAVAGYLSPEDLVRIARQGRFSLAAQHALFKRSALLEVGGWRPELRWFTDCFSSWVIGFRHGICHVPEVLSVFHTAPTSYYHSAQSVRERRATLRLLLCLLAEPGFADVASRIAASGLIGGLGGFAVRTVLAERRFWSYMSLPFLRHTLRRSAEVLGRRILPQPIARLASRILYPGPRTKSAGPWAR